ncbi:MAG: hypothetical protein KDB21_09500 [Acidimicrobiales bacterium]|nr:hypothetical protein [Acidimicrobiales bacterium]
MDDALPSSPAYDEAVTAADAVAEKYRAGDLSAARAAEQLAAAFGTYLASADPRDELGLLTDYFLALGDELATDPISGDRHLARWLEEELAWRISRPVLRARLDFMLTELREALDVGDAEARQQVAAICRYGGRSHAPLFVPLDWGIEMLRLAHEYRIVDALVGALEPFNAGRLGAPGRDRNRAERVALDLLAHLAAEPAGPVGVEARDGLLHLAGHLEVGAKAAVRLPVHLLSDEQRRQLVALLDNWDSVVSSDRSVIRPPNHALLRDLEVVRSTAWLAGDAARL